MATTRDPHTTHPRRARRESRTERLDLRLTPELKRAIAHAAALSGQSLSSFAITALMRQAEETVHTHQVITLSAEASLEFAKALLEPPAPTPALVEAFRQAHRLVEDVG